MPMTFPIVSGHPGYVASRFYMPYYATLTSGSAVPTLDTVVFLHPFSAQDYPLVATSLSVRVVTGAAGSAIKMAVWATSPTTKRPTGLALVGSNTGQATTGSGTTATIAISRTFEPGVIYWFGAAVTTLAPTLVAVAATASDPGALMGRSAASGILSGLTAPYAYAGDIMALDLTAATFTDVTANGVPAAYIGT